MAQTVPARQTVQNMTDGSPVSLILRFALPIFISQVFQQLYSTADAFIVGTYLGPNAFAAVSRAASNINQICRRINSTGHCYEDDVAELKARQAEIWELLKVRQKDEL